MMIVGENFSATYTTKMTGLQKQQLDLQICYYQPHQVGRAGILTPVRRLKRQSEL
jgi:hypothetical protein